MLNRYNKQDTYDRQKKSVAVARVLSIFWPFYNLYLRNIEAAFMSALVLVVIYLALDPLFMAVVVHIIGIALHQYGLKVRVADYNYKLYKKIFHVKTIDNG